MNSSQSTSSALEALKISEVIDILCQLNADNPVDFVGDLNWLCGRNIAALDVGTKLNIDAEEIINLTPEIKKLNPDDQSDVWQYICLNIYYLQYLGDVCKKQNESWSVQQLRHLKNVLRNVVGIGISSNLLPNLPYYTKLPSEEKQPVPVLTRYKRLAGTSYGICMSARAVHLRPLIIPNYTKWILSALYQILYCPLKKPSSKPDENGFIMTEQIYRDLVNNRAHFEPFLIELSSSVHTVLYVRETMMLLAKNSPMWLKRAISSTLSTTIRGPKGVETIAWAMLDAAGVDDPDDSTKSWKSLDVIAKIIMDSRKLADFQENICKQLCDLLKLKNNEGESVRPFERLFALCTKLLFQQDEPLCQEVFIKRLLEPLICFTNEEHNFSNSEHVTEPISQTMRLLHSSLVERNFNIPALPAHVLIPAVSVVFRLYAVTFNTSGLKNLNDDIKAVLLQVIIELETDRKFELFDNFLFGFPCEHCRNFRDDIEIVVESNYLGVRLNDYSVGLRPLNRAEALHHLLKENNAAITTIFTYLLNCLINREKYFNTRATKRDLLHLEADAVLDEITERSIAVYKLLSELAEDKTVQKHINENPADVVRYVHAVFLKTIETKVHKTTEFETEGFQSLFLVVMLLQALVENPPKGNLDHYKVLEQPLEIISKECINTELKELSKAILAKFPRGVKEEVAKKNQTFEMFELDKALEDICDPLLPVRGHGLVALAKLVEKKDEHALERKQYILNVFQQNLKNEDSFIYLGAIRGLAAMGDIFPETVLSALAEEYSDFTRKDSEDGHEVRLKLGEVLLRVIRLLGDTAPKYKTLLLNAFLVGTKDEDHLIRASSLSNLGEVCRVLGYKLGSIVTEVLVCVHAIISTDKAAEARRAAVTVIRQLFVGLEKGTIVFLKDEILPVYRTLKHIYYHDSDDVMRLQAQLALEQLNENVKEFIFPNLQLHNEKKIVMLN